MVNRSPCLVTQPLVKYCIQCCSSSIQFWRTLLGTTTATRALPGLSIFVVRYKSARMMACTSGGGAFPWYVVHPSCQPSDHHAGSCTNGALQKAHYALVVKWKPHVSHRV
jgi:hypothetical protein